ncbi:MAG TPA: hypothetical protein VF484_10635 [Candidatus Limnocylindrales bacterium]
MFLATMLGAAVPLAALGARPVSSIDSVTVTASGGTWPTCSQEVTVEVTAGGAAKWIVIWPMPGPGFLGGYVGLATLGRIPSGASSVEITVTQDYSVLAEQGAAPVWKWDLGLTSRTMRVLNPEPARVSTGAYDFAGRCPTTGTVLASWP